MCTCDGVIESILDEFDFHKVHGVMEFMGWVYSRDREKDPDIRQGANEVPSVSRLKHTARELLTDVAHDPEDGFVSSSDGGFVASKQAGKNTLWLSFEVESVDIRDIIGE